MKEKEIDLSLVYFSIFHEGCWSNLTENFPIKVHTVFSKPQREKDSILGLIEIKSNNNSSIRSFIRQFRIHRTIKKLLGYNQISDFSNHYKILFLENYSNMLMGVLDNYTILYTNDLINNGIENIFLIISSKEVQELKSSISNLGKVLEFKIQSIIDEDIFLDYNLMLSEKELEVLKKAYMLGYYKFPRKTTIAKISESLSLSKSTVEEHLRKAENKIIFYKVLKYL